MVLNATTRTARASDRVMALAKSRPFSPVALRLLQLVRDEDVSFREVAVLMSRDPALSAEVLRLANSPVFGTRSEVRSVLQAISLLGLKRVMPLFMTSAVSRFCWPRNKSPLIRCFWRHGLACAFLCEHLGPHQLYTAGLLHGLGQTALLALDPKNYEGLAETSRENSLPTRDCELSGFGIHHAEAGALLLEHWRLPEDLITSAREHERPCESLDTVNGIVQAGCRIAESLGFGGCESFADSPGLPQLPQAASQLIENKSLLDQIALQINAVEIALWV